MAVSSVKVSKPSAVKNYKLPTYTSQYAGAINESIDNLANFNYDPMQDASFRAMASWYNSAGDRAAKNTMGDAAMLNGGYGSSYATSAAQQARNDYNQQLAALIPEYEQRQYDRMKDQFGIYMDAENWKYGQYRDKVQDSKDMWNMNYGKYRDKMSDYQWGMNFNLDLSNSKKGSSSGGGGRRSGGGSGGYSGGYSGSGSTASAPSTTGSAKTASTNPALNHEEHGEYYSGTKDRYKQRKDAGGRITFTNVNSKAVKDALKKKK